MKIQQLLPLFVLSIYLIACTPNNDIQLKGELKQWHKITLTLDGPVLSEDTTDNPFLNYRLMAVFQHQDRSYRVPGYFAADGQAGESSATAGNKWRIHFNPDAVGTWTYTISFVQGEGIAIDDEAKGTALELDGTSGTFEVAESDKTARDFRANGRIGVNADNQYFQFAGSEAYFLKTGADSPENFLAYHEFDGTYRHSKEVRDGENKPTEGLHYYAAHLADWQEGDPTWKDQQGKGIIGALNYLADQGMNAVYFLVMNIGGDGKDVWPYTSHEERFRFDCSKLDQWEVVFEHMEQLGLMMHVVTQETENEKLLDDGDTGQERQIFYRELIARFGHHNALVWNLGEENGPANFSPNGQNTAQRKAMANYLKKHDPYQHPVVLHTHAWRGHKDDILTDLLGFEALDGLSFQVDKRAQVHEEILKWDSLSVANEHPWMIAMDEIGMWHTGVMDDASNPRHDTIRQQVLWASLMAGAKGVEWYFGAYYPHNDLTCEDWRSRENMWTQTRYATDFFHQYLNFWEMESKDELVSTADAYCLAKTGEQYAIYFPMNSEGNHKIDLQANTKSYQVSWYNPREGGALQMGNVTEIIGSGWHDLGQPPSTPDMDWVALVQAM